MIDVGTSIFALVLAIICLFEASMIWRVRDGSLFIRALCMQLTSFGVWGCLVFASVFYEWTQRLVMPEIGLNIRLVDRLVLCIPQAYIILFVIPRAKH